MFENEPSTMPGVPTPPSPQDVHTMPERFLDSGSSNPIGGPAMPSPKAGGPGKKLIMIVVVVVVLAALGGGVWYYFTKLANKNANTNGNLPTNLNVNRNANGNLPTNLNVNRNANGNLNVNTNANANANVNANANLNANVNTNANANANVNANANSNTNTSIGTIGSPLASSADEDLDGLTDIEEAVYGTQTNKADSDGDGFIDGLRTLTSGKVEGEVYNGYCPTKVGNVKLDDAACNVVRTFTNTTYSYALWVPKNWLAQSTSSADNKTIIITPDVATSEFFQVSVLDNPTQLTARSYYLSLNPGIDSSKLRDATINGLDGVMSLDESTVYFVKGTKIYIVTYNSDSLSKVNFKTTFTMMWRSFHLVASTGGTNTNANANLNTNVNSNSNTNAPVFQ